MNVWQEWKAGANICLVVSIGLLIGLFAAFLVSSGIVMLAGVLRVNNPEAHLGELTVVLAIGFVPWLMGGTPRRMLRELNSN